MRDLSRIRNALFNAPWLLTEDKMDTVASIVSEAMSNPEMSAAMRNPKPAEPTGLQFRSGIPIIPIDGVITKRASIFQSFSGGTSIDGLNALWDQALATNAQAIALEIFSPGGSVQGVAEFASRVSREANNGKKIVLAFADSMAASAAYWIGSQANIFTASESAQVGSIGVVVAFSDTSRMEKNAGIDTEVFKTANLKAIGSTPLDNQQRAKLQADMGTIFEMFKSAVVRGRPGIDIEAASTGETWIGQQAVDAGLVDGIGTLEDLLAPYAS